MATSYLSRTFGTPTDAKKWTFSSWCKKGTNGTYHIFGGGATGQTGDGHSYLGLVPEFYAIYYDGTTHWHLYSNDAFRDTSGWYHFMFVYDSAQATASNRAKAYINNRQLTSFSVETYPSLNYSTMWNNSGITHYIARRGQSQGFEGSLAHVHFCDGYAYSPSDFGSTDSTTGIWKPTTNPSVSYGNNGFFLNFENTSNYGEDSSGNNNDFTSSGTITQTIDTPSNVFATLNYLDFGLSGSDPVLANGNLTTMATTGASDYGLRATLGVNKGKWYWEAKYTTGNCTGILPTDAKLIFDMFGSTPEPHLYGVQRYNDSYTNFYYNTTFNQQNTAAWGGITSGDIIGCALDMDNGKIFYSKNGNFRDLNGNTGDPANGTYPTFTIADTSKTYAPYVELRSNNDNGTKMNFGNGYFGTDAVSSAGTNAGVGTFEYDVPSGFKALCTKNINTQEYN